MPVLAVVCFMGMRMKSSRELRTSKRHMATSVTVKQDIMNTTQRPAALLVNHRLRRWKIAMVSRVSLRAP